MAEVAPEQRNYRQHYCHHGVRSHRTSLRDCSDGVILDLIRTYTPLGEYERASVDYREHRRCAIRIALERGLIPTDPGGAP